MENRKRIVLGTNNPHKKEKLRWIVDGYFSEIEDMLGEIEVEENSDTFEGNARIKALAVAKKNNSYAIATDGGVLIPSLGNNWNGLLTRRFAGRENVDDFDRMDYLLEIMKDKKGQDRTIVWKESVAIADPEGIIFSTEVDGDTGVLQGTYNPKQYKKGIWLCTLWSYPQFGGRNFFELNEEEKKYGEISWWRLKEKTREFLSSYLVKK
jgi:inosine/xanthosine triphosphate pyrophosphatase family protein